MIDLPPDWKELLEEFAREGVEHVLIGGHAVAFHARPRATKDLDLVLRGTSENLARAAKALATFGVPGTVVDAARNLGPSEVVYIGQPPLRIDLLREIDGVDAEEVFAAAISTTWSGIAIKVISLEHLIANKKAADRLQDRADVAVLEKVQARAEKARAH